MKVKFTNLLSLLLIAHKYINIYIYIYTKLQAFTTVTLLKRDSNTCFPVNTEKFSIAIGNFQFSIFNLNSNFQFSNSYRLSPEAAALTCF